MSSSTSYRRPPRTQTYANPNPNPSSPQRSSPQRSRPTTSPRSQPTSPPRMHQHTSPPIASRPAPRRQSLPTPVSTSSLPSTTATRNSRTALIPPPTPLPSHPSADRTAPSGLSTAATAFALKAYLETYLLSLGWDPSLLSASAFITQYSWLLGEELSLPAPVAAGIFNELFDATTPTMAGVCHAVIGMEEKLGCSRQAAKAVRRLFTKNHDGKSPEWALANWCEEALEGKCGPDVVRGRKRVGGWWAVVRVATGKLCGKKKGADGSETDGETVVGEKR